MPPSSKLQIGLHFTKSTERDNIYKKLWMPEEHNYLILTSYHVPKVRYRAHGPKWKPLLHYTESLESDDIKIIG